MKSASLAQISGFSIQNSSLESLVSLKKKRKLRFRLFFLQYCQVWIGGDLQSSIINKIHLNHIACILNKNFNYEGVMSITNSRKAGACCVKKITIQSFMSINQENYLCCKVISNFSILLLQRLTTHSLNYAILPCLNVFEQTSNVYHHPCQSFSYY